MLDLDRAESEMKAVAENLVREHPGISCIVLECTNMPPFRKAIGLPAGGPFTTL